MPNLKLRSRTHHWKETNRIEIMKLLAFFCYKDFTRNWITSYFTWSNNLEIPLLLDVFSERRLHLLLKFLHFVGKKKCQHHETRHNSENCSVALCAAPFLMLPYGSWLLEAWKEIEVQQVSECKILVATKCTMDWYWKPHHNYKDFHSMCQWSCNSVSGGIIVLVMIA
jgi:hypothetical protein